jgi:hypothetical protein
VANAVMPSVASLLGVAAVRTYDRIVRRVLLIVVAALVLVAPEAGAADQVSTDIKLRYGINPDGRGELIANPSPYGTGAITWTACPPGAGCSSVVPTAPNGRILNVGSAVTGTTFVATSIQGARTVSTTSDPYLGPVRSTAPPGSIGTPTVGASVRPVPGAWSGGWGRERSVTQTQLCRDAGASRCVVIADSIYWHKCPSAGAVLLRAYRGWYLRIIEKRISVETPYAPTGVLTPLDLRPAKPGPAAAATLVGPVRGPGGPAQSDCGKPPSSLHPAFRARRVNGRLRLGRVICVERCRVSVSVRQRDVSVRSASRHRGSLTPHSLILGRKPARRLRSGKALVTLEVVPGRRLSGFPIKISDR